MKKYIKIVSIFLCLFLVLPLSAQQKEKKGTKHKISALVVDENGNPMVGVLVIANEGADQTTTDNNGTFSLDVKQGSNFIFESVGYQKLSMNESQLIAKSGKVDMSIEINPNIEGIVNLPYHSLERFKSTGSISVIDPNKEIERDTRFDLATAINGKVSGTLGAYNIHGMGTAVIIVDGVKRDATYLNMQEIESITVLKDAVSRMLYGSDGDQGVILVKTKNGEANKKVMKFNVEQGMQNAISYPKFLNSAQYMTAYNKAAQNDASFAGTDLAAPKYSATDISNSTGLTNPIMYPDNNYYGSDYVKNSTNFTNVYGELSGGNENTQYFMNLGWKHNDGWTKIGNSDKQDVLNIRGKVNFKVASWLKMNSEVVAVFDFKNTPNVNTYNTDGSVNLDYWKKASTYLPNTQTLLLPISLITNSSILPNSSIIDGQYVLGGSGLYPSSLYGDMTRSGKDTQMNRYVQFNNSFNLDLSSITKGLTGKGLLSLDFTNTYHQTIMNTYSVYQMSVANPDGTFSVSPIGSDVKTTKQTIDEKNMYFDRNVLAYMSLNYNRTFGKHAISAVLIGSFKDYTEMDVFQQEKKVSFGGQANYTYNDKYVVEAGALSQASSKLPTNNKFGIAPTVGLAWIASKEGFLKSIDAINYLKFRTSYGVLQNDNWNLGKYNGYFLYEPIYNTGNLFTYGNGVQSNKALLIASLGNNITWQKRKEFVAGFDASLFNNKTWLEASYFNSENGNVVTEMKNNTPATLGSVVQFQNYNTTVYKGIEVGIKHTIQTGKFTLTAGANYMYSTSNITKIDEPVYNLPINFNLEKIGTSANSLWGLTSTGLYLASDFDSNGKLLNTLPATTYGSVKPGDIKYQDINSDNKIDANDFKILGLSANNQQYSFDFDMKYGNWQFYILGIGQTGGKGFTNSNYYWFKGTTAKYSEVALGAFDPMNPDANAAYPRLSLSNGTNNYQNSSFWIYDKSYFSLSALQLGYNFKFNGSSTVKGLKVYARGSNLLTVAKDNKIQKLNYQSTPQSRVFSLGVIASF
jgi:TonB-linked SusC/RagA family outer membrane protein